MAMIKVVRWPDCDVLESNLQKVDEFWYKTNVGPISVGYIFPFSQLNKLKELKGRIDAKRKELSDIEAEIYAVSRDYTK